MHALFRQRGSQFSVDIVAAPDAVAFISEHAAALDSSFEQVPMSDAMRRRLSRSNFIFSGMKALHELPRLSPRSSKRTVFASRSNGFKQDL